MYVSISQTTAEPITATAYTSTDRQPAEVQVMFSHRASVHLSPAEATELISVLTTALAELSAQTMVGA